MKKFLVLSLFFSTILSSYLLAAPSKTVPKKAKQNEPPAKVLVTTNQGTFTIELYPKEAPLTVSRFLKNVSSRYYTHTIFSRYISNFIIVGGTSKKKNKKTQTGKSEWSKTLSHKRGMVGIMRKAYTDSEGNQFYICLSREPDLDKQYSLFGHVINGMEDVVASLRPGDRIVRMDIIKKKKRKKVTKRKKRRKKKSRKK